MKRKLFYAFCALTIFSVVFAGCDNGTTGGSETIISQLQWSAGIIQLKDWDDAFENHDKVTISYNTNNPSIEPVLGETGKVYIVPEGKVLDLNGHVLTVGNSTDSSSAFVTLVIAGRVERGENSNGEKGRIIKAVSDDIIAVNDPWHPYGQDPYEEYGVQIADTVEVLKILPLPNENGVIQFEYASESDVLYYLGDFDLYADRTENGYALSGVELGGKTVYIFGNLSTAKVVSDTSPSLAHPAPTPITNGGILYVYGTLTTPYLGSPSDSKETEIVVTKLGMPSAEKITVASKLTLFEDSEVSAGKHIVFNQAGTEVIPTTGGVAVLAGSETHDVDGTNGGAGKIIIKSGAICEIQSLSTGAISPIVPLYAYNGQKLISDFAGIVIEAGGQLYRNAVTAANGARVATGDWANAPAITTPTDPWVNSVYYIGPVVEGAPSSDPVPVFAMEPGSKISFTDGDTLATATTGKEFQVMTIEGNVHLTETITITDENIEVKNGTLTIAAGKTLTGVVPGVVGTLIPHSLTINAGAALDLSAAGATVALTKHATYPYQVVLVPAMVLEASGVKDGGGGKVLLNTPTGASTLLSINGLWNGLNKTDAFATTGIFTDGTGSGSVFKNVGGSSAAKWTQPAGAQSPVQIPSTGATAATIEYIDAGTSTFTVESGNIRVPSTGYIVFSALGATNNNTLSSASTFWW